MRHNRVDIGVALYRMGRNATIDPVRRSIARLLSVYERAPLRLVLAHTSDALILIEGIGACSIAWILLRTGRRNAYDNLSTEVPLHSGWAGSVLFVAVWAIAIASAVRIWT